MPRLGLPQPPILPTWERALPFTVSQGKAGPWRPSGRLPSRNKGLQPRVNPRPQASVAARHLNHSSSSVEPGAETYPCFPGVGKRRAAL